VPPLHDFKIRYQYLNLLLYLFLSRVFILSFVICFMKKSTCKLLLRVGILIILFSFYKGVTSSFGVPYTIYNTLFLFPLITLTGIILIIIALIKWNPEKKVKKKRRKK